MPLDEKKVYLLLTATAVLWGGNAVTAKFTVGELSPSVVVFVRFTGVTIILLAMTLLTNGKKGLPTVRQLPGIIALGIIGIFLQNYLFYTGVKYSTATNASLLAAANPTITALLTAIFYHEKLRPKQLYGIGVSFLGVAIVVTKGSWQVISQLEFNYGDVLLAIAPVTWAIYSLIGRRVMQQIPALTATAWSSLVGTVLLFILALSEGFTGQIQLSAYGWANMIYMIIGSGVLAFYWWNKGVAVIGPNRAAIFVNIIPVAGMICAALLLHEAITMLQIAGAIMIIAGVWLTTQAEAAVKTGTNN